MLGEGPGRAVAMWQRLELRAHSLRQLGRGKAGCWPRAFVRSKDMFLGYGFPGLQSCQNKWPLFQATWVGSLKA